jgi:DNA replication and repair protein RecF
MGLVRLSVSDLRNLRVVEIEPIGRVNFVVGQNGSGKTSLLEAIYLLGFATSFRTHDKLRLINSESHRLWIAGNVEYRSTGSSQIGLEIGQRGKAIKIRINGKGITRASDLLRCLPITLISPEDHRIFELGPKYRRRFLDWGVFHVEPSYIETWREYHHTLRQRNSAIKHGESPSVWDSLLAQRARVLTSHRESYVTNLHHELQALTANFELVNAVELRLQPGWPSGRTFLEHLNEQRDSDIAARTTQWGPHRADVAIEVLGQPANAFLSRGQIKLLICALRIAQAILLFKTTGREGLLLADDLGVELDVTARARVLEMIYNSNLQSFITATTTAEFNLERLAEVRVFHVEHGGVVAPVSPPNGVR